MVIYTVLAKKIEKINKKIEKIEKKLKKIKNARNNFWGPCQVLNISRKTLRSFGQKLDSLQAGQERTGQ